MDQLSKNRATHHDSFIQVKSVHTQSERQKRTTLGPASRLLSTGVTVLRDKHTGAPTALLTGCRTPFPGSEIVLLLSIDLRAMTGTNPFLGQL